MNLLFTLSLILFFCAVLVGAFAAIGKITYFRQQEEEAGRYFKWGFALDLFVWLAILVNLTLYVDSWLGKAAIFLFGSAIIALLEFVKARERMKTRNKSLRNTQW